ncbi:MAG: carboxypeptidase regulatory-like domain-containing protein, partial [Candidatus Berkelbacteria bacterium]|nr:carboxypeptidase regulatory-like domain-containing protein [Candidatus Berkelbacteria bacterium]
GETSFHNTDAGSTYLFTFSLIPIQGQYVYGRVIDKDTKRAINGARVQIIQNDNFTGKEGTTNEYGRYYIENPGSGTMVVRALHTDYYDDSASRKEITLAAGEDKEVNFRLRKLDSPVDTFDLTIDHIYKMENGNQVLIGDQDAVEIRLSSGFDPYSKRIIYGESVSEKGPKQPFHTFYRLPIYPTAIKATIFNPSDNDPGWVPKYRTVAEIHPTTSDPMTIDLVLEPILLPPDYSGGGIVRGTTSLFVDPCQALADEIREFFHSFTSRVPAPKGIPVYLYHPYDHINPVQTTTTDVAGEFEFTNLPVGTYDIKVESRNYLGWQEAAQVAGGDSIGNYSIVLAGKSSGMTKTRYYHNIKVKFVGFGSHSYIGKFDWNNEINEVTKIHNQTTYANPIPTIYVVESDFPVGVKLTDICGERIVVTTRMLQAIIDNKQKLRYLIAHEYAHKYYRVAGFWVPWVGHFGTIFNAAKDAAPCSFSRITDSNISLDQLYMGHPEDGKNEYFASFFTAYFLHHDRLLDTIRNNTSGECKNTLSYTWQWFAENVGKVYTNDNEIFHPLNGAISGIDYTKAQIKNGDWIDPPYR